MLNRLALFPAFLVLFGCPQLERPVAPRPDVPPAEARLAPGNYRLRVQHIHALSCDVIDPRQVEGAEMALEVRFNGPQALLDLEGLPLEGWMRNGVLRGFAAFPGEGEVTVQPTEDSAEADDAAPADEEEKDEARADEGDDEAGSEGGGAAPPPRPDAPMHGQVELILDIQSDARAVGALNVSYAPGCELRLDVDVVAGGESPPALPGEESSPCDSDEEDCG